MMTADEGAAGSEREEPELSPHEAARIDSVPLESASYEEVLGQTVSSEHFDSKGTAALARHDTSRRLRAARRSMEVEEVLVRSADDTAFGGSGLDFQAAGLLEKRLLHTSNLSLDEIHALEEDEAELGLNERAIPGRYDILDILGEGASGQVFAAQDHNIGRDVAVKFLHPDDAADGDKMQRFVKEAQVTASLEHPNILPVFDFDLTDGGLAFFTMRKATGCTLFDAIKRSERSGRAAPEIATYNDRVGIMLKVCDALAYAHDRGIIHQDVKPSNIMLGAHAAVVLVDWGTALTLEDREAEKVPLMGTPAYMAPEQARREHVDERSDVYCLGTTFFQLLTLRYPTWADDPDSFWEMKRAGIYQAPGEDERRRIPGALLDIALKAIAPEPRDRYPTVEAMRRDLLNYQEGLAISAHDDSLAELLARWYRLNRKAVWVAMAAMLLIAGLAGIYAYEKRKELTTWHHLATQDFDFLDLYKLERDWIGTAIPEWQNNQARPAPFEAPAWTLSDGRLVMAATDGMVECLNLAYRRPLPDDFRVSWIATPLESTENLNCFLGGHDRTDSYVFHVGGYADPSSVLLTKGPKRQVLERRSLLRPIEIGRSYAFQLEKHDNLVRLSIDGQPVIAFNDPDMNVGPERNTFGFEVATNRTAIDRVRIEYLPLAQKIDPIEVADSFYARHHYAEAMEHYQRIRTLYPATGMAVRSAYRIGRCLAGLERPGEAIAALSLFAAEHPKHPLAHYARFDLANIAVRNRDWTLTEDALENLAANQPPPNLRRAGMLAAEEFLRRRDRIDEWQPLLAPEPAARLVSTLDRLEYWRERFNDRRSAPVNDVYDLEHHIVVLLSNLGEHELIIERFPDHATRVVAALIDMGRAEEAERRFSDQPNRMITILGWSGRWEEILERFPEHDDAVFSAMIALERFDEARQRFPQRQTEIEVQRLMSEKRFDQALALVTPNSKSGHDILWAAGRYPEVQGKSWHWRDWEIMLITGQAAEYIADRSQIGTIYYAKAHAMLLLEALLDQDAVAAERWQDALESLPVLDSYDPFDRLLLPLLIDTFSGRPDALAAAAPELEARYGQRFQGAVSEITGYLLGSTDRLTGPWAKNALHFHGIRAELAGDREAAIGHYRSVLSETSDHWRPSSRFCAWRLQKLGVEP